MEDDEQPFGERDRIRRWQIEQFERFGILSRYECEELVDQGCDWRQMKRLLDLGCTPRLALKIIR
jgi:hypothetical protein